MPIHLCVVACFALWAKTCMLIEVPVDTESQAGAPMPVLNGCGIPNVQPGVTLIEGGQAFTTTGAAICTLTPCGVPEQRRAER